MPACMSVCLCFYGGICRYGCLCLGTRLYKCLCVYLGGGGGWLCLCVYLGEGGLSLSVCLSVCVLFASMAVSVCSCFYTFGYGCVCLLVFLYL